MGRLWFESCVLRLIFCQKRCFMPRSTGHFGRYVCRNLSVWCDVIVCLMFAAGVGVRMCQRAEGVAVPENGALSVSKAGRWFEV